MHPGPNTVTWTAASVKVVPLALRAEVPSSLPPWKGEAALRRNLLQTQLIPDALLCGLEAAPSVVVILTLDFELRTPLFPACGICVLT